MERFITRLHAVDLPVTVEGRFGNHVLRGDVPECVSRFQRRFNREALRCVQIVQERPTVGYVYSVP